MTSTPHSDNLALNNSQSKLIIQKERISSAFEKHLFTPKPITKPKNKSGQPKDKLPSAVFSNA